MLAIEEVFLSLFLFTFLVAIVAFASYGYLLVLLLRNHSEKFNPKTTGEFLHFLWQLLFYYIHRSLSGFFGFEKGKDFEFMSVNDRVVRDAESEQSRLIKVYSIFSATYILFFILFIALSIIFIYMVFGY
ncbi:hypothetical protein BH23BAC3_BH23BAC3_00460 [soil metagenome]